MELNWELIDLICSVIVQNIIIGTLLIATPKRSPYRFLAIPILIWNASRFARPLDFSVYIRTNAVSCLVVAVITAINVLLINPLDERDLAREMPTTFFRSGHFYYVFEILSFTRGIKTPRQVKNLPAQPAFYDRYGGKIPVGRYLLRQLAIMAWQFMVIDIFQTLSGQMASEAGLQEIEYNVPMEKWIERAIAHNITWFLVGRLIIDCSFRLSSIVFVSLGLDEPSNWLPVFGRMKDAYSLRNFWGKFWHQMLRQPFTTMSNFLARDVLHLPRPSILERYTNTFIVFFLSGVMHFILDIVADIPWELSGAMHFFLSFVLGIMIEDGVQALWKRVSPPQISKDGEVVTPLWKKVVERLAQLPRTDLVPLSVVSKLGIETGGGLACVGALLLWFTVAPEV
ncbi:hypothetical protein N7533_001752 [Penicillium manginii]|uniref:uncharacterized protein n=1 Tax=Penicillium manginii TaxID=203109 RepID=UPI00254961A2|nr:uncharacterized protein N7533_001752 [Penicillium manginii]KAJ5763071.1 hypothetical protein N7533_001752 [Penicillium manginii]